LGLDVAMMMDPRLISISKFLSLILRHKPEEIGLVLDENGWAELAELVRLSNQYGKRLTRQLVEEVVARNEKQRFTISPDGAKIRANQGHSVEVDLGLAPVEPPELLFHGTVERFLDSIRLQGLRRGDRTHVHLSADEHTARGVGARRGRPIVLTVAAQMMFENGHLFYLSQNGVWLTEHVPPQFLGYSG
jgi:putative RNA 2'-phosphotransferase